MARKKEKVIHLITDAFEGSAIETLQTFEPGPVFIVSGETPDGLGIYLCNEAFTLEEAEAQHNLEEPLDIESEFDDLGAEAGVDLAELE